MARAPSALRTVLFDLDGTLADTAPDLGYALNLLLAERGREPLSLARTRPHASHGARGLIRLGFGIEPSDASFAALRRRFLELYAAHLTRESRLFPGVADLLDALETRGLRWGVVTNKPAELTLPLLEELGLAHRAVCVVSGDTTPRPKPDPAPVLHACAVSGTDPARCVYVGDSQRDIESGRRAGTRTLVALFGYIDASESPERWGADGLVQQPGQILRWVETRGP